MVAVGLDGGEQRIAPGPVAHLHGEHLQAGELGGLEPVPAVDQEQVLADQERGQRRELCARLHIGRVVVDGRLVHRVPAPQLRIQDDVLEVFTRRIKQLDRDIETLLDDHDVGKLITTIPGLGANSAARILANADPTEFRNAKAFTAYFGITPFTRKSGTSMTSDRARIIKIGNADVRRKLWMPTLTAIQNNPVVAPFYERLRQRGKPPKVALVAAMRKLLTVVYAVAKQGRPFEVRSETG